jgi:hypothetical protein
MRLVSLFPPPPPAHYPNAAEITLSSVKLGLLLSEVHCCHTLHEETLFNNVMKNMLHVFLKGYFTFSLFTFCKFN